MFKTKSPERALLLLQRAQLSVFRASTGKIFTAPLPPTLVVDLEVQDEQLFINAIKNFVLTQKINQAEVVIVLDSSVYFTQEVAEEKQEDEAKIKDADKGEKNTSSTKQATTPLVEETFAEEQRKLFVQSMPFADVFSRVVTVGKKKYIIAMNRDLYEPIVKVLNDSKLNVTHIYPIMIFTELFESGGFTPATAGKLLENREKYKMNNFLQPSRIPQEEIITTVMPTENKDKKRVLLLVVLFVVLLGILAGVWWWSQNATDNKNPARKGPAQPATGVSHTSATPSPVTPAATPIVLLEQLLTSTQSAELNVEISDASGDQTSADSLQEQLEDIGFVEVTIVDTITQQTGSMSITVNDSVPTNMREALLQQFEDWGYSTRFEVDSSRDAAISIIVTSP